MAILGLIGLLGGTALTCVAPRTRLEREMDIAGALVLVGALVLIGARLARSVCGG